jgi:signal transduction histidine kinase
MNLPSPFKHPTRASGLFRAVWRVPRLMLQFVTRVVMTVVERIRKLLLHASYPLFLQILISIMLLATLPSTYGEGSDFSSTPFLLRCLLVGVHIALCWLLPVKNIGPWWQTVYLAFQVLLTSLTQVILPSPLLIYVYLAIVLQAIYLFKPIYWIPFAVMVFAVWNGTFIVASASMVEWLQANLSIVFPFMCISAAAGLYFRQHQRHQQEQAELQAEEHRYESLLEQLHQAPEHAALEERQRLSQTISTDIANTLAQIEQNISASISQAQSNLVRLEQQLDQARDATASALEYMRTAVSTLRLPSREEEQPQADIAPIEVQTELFTMRWQQVITWLLPLSFILIALPLTVLQGQTNLTTILLSILCCGILLLGYVLTQRINNPLLMRMGLVGQATAILGMVAASQTIPLLLGLLLVLWQMAIRLPLGQLLTFLVGVPALLSLSLTPLLPFDQLSIDNADIITFCVACITVGGLIATSRNVLKRRQATNTRRTQLTNLSCELQQQLRQAQQLAVAVERTRVARELHDDIGHRLVVLNLQLQIIDELIEDDPSSAIEQLLSTREQLREVWSSMISSTDAALALDHRTIIPAIENLIERSSGVSSINFDLRVHGEIEYINEPIACALYRAVQEGLTNIYKYAQASKASITIYGSQELIQVRIRNNGQSSGELVRPVTQQIYTSGHFGLTGLRERAELLGGTVTAESLPDGGFALTMTIPLS